MRGCVRTHSLIHTFLTYTHTIYSQYDPRELVRLNGGKPALTMQAFTSLCDRAGDPPAPAPDPPATLPSVGDGEGALVVALVDTVCQSGRGDLDALLPQQRCMNHSQRG